MWVLLFIASALLLTLFFGGPASPACFLRRMLILLGGGSLSIMVMCLTVVVEVVIGVHKIGVTDTLWPSAIIMTIVMLRLWASPRGYSQLRAYWKDNG